MAITFEQYLPRLLDPAARLAVSELRVLSALTPRQLRALAQAWPRIALPRRRRLVQLMAELAEDNVDLDYNAVFKIALRDTDDEVRRRAADGLWEDEDLTTADALVDVLRGDPSPAVRAAAATSLGHFVCALELEDLDLKTGERIKEALYGAIENQAEPMEVRRRAVEAVGYLSEERARSAIAAAYADAAAKMRASAVFAMGRSCDRRWLPAVLTELENADAEMRFEAARASGEIEDRRAVPLLVKLLRDADREVRVAAVGALGAIGGPEAKQALRQVAQGTDEELALAAEEALEEIEIGEDPLHMRFPEIGEN